MHLLKRQDRPLRCATTLALLLVLLISTAQAQGIDALKAAYVYNFSRFISWPAEDDADITICAYTGNSEIVKQLKTLQGKSIGQGVLNIEELREPLDAAGLAHCRILYTDQSEWLGQQSFPAQHVLVIAEEMQAQTVIAFSQEGGKLTFDIHLPRAQEQQLKISSRLLDLARQVHQ